MGLDGKIYRLECVTDYTVDNTCAIKDTSCVYDGGLPGASGSTIPIFCTKELLLLL